MRVYKSFLVAVCALFLSLVLDVPAFGAGEAPRLVDDAGLLTEGEESNLLDKLDEISHKQKADVVVVTVDSLEGKSPMEYADDYFDYNGYGYGEDRDGIILLVSMEDRDYWMSTRGFGITAFTDAGLEFIADEFVPELSDGDYDKAFDLFADRCDEFLTQARKGRPYDRGHMPREKFELLENMLISLAGGFVIALISVLVMMSKMKSVRFNNVAGNYVKENSLSITDSRELFLYFTVNRTARSKNNGSGSSVHTSSSGASHGGSGGKF